MLRTATGSESDFTLGFRSKLSAFSLDIMNVEDYILSMVTIFFTKDIDTPNITCIWLHTDANRNKLPIIDAQRGQADVRHFCAIDKRAFVIDAPDLQQAILRTVDTHPIRG